MPACLRDRDGGNLVELSLEEQTHREVYIAILNSALREVGSKARLAQRLGISRAYLSYLLHPDPRTSDSFRRPSPRIADAIARALPVEPEVRDALREHMYQAHTGRIRRQRALAEDLRAWGPFIASCSSRPMRSTGGAWAIRPRRRTMRGRRWLSAKPRGLRIR